MSSMIKCDGCGKLMHADSRSASDAYHEFWVDRVDSCHLCKDSWHLCKDCYTKFMNDILHRHWDPQKGEFVERVDFRQWL